MTRSDLPVSEQQRFWNWHWQHWRERRTINSWKDQRHQAIVELIASLSLQGARILDLGCGPGYYTRAFTRFGEVTGIDLSDDAIRVARDNYPEITFLVGNLFEMSLPGDHFGVVVAQEVIDHVEDQAAFVRRATDILKPGGHLVLSCANRFVMDRLRPGDFPAQPPEHISRYKTIREWRNVLRDDLDVLQIRSILPELGSRGVLKLVSSHKLTALLGALLGSRRVTALKERSGLGYTLIILARKRLGPRRRSSSADVR